MNPFSKNPVLLLLPLLFTLAVWANAHADTKFTYQGQLQSAGGLLNDTADFEFALWDADSAGNMIGAVWPVDDVTVTDGQFTVELDFGADAFSSESRWIEISVRSPAGGGDFTMLNPRQAITGAPFSLQTRGMFVNADKRVGIGTSNPSVEAQLHVSSQVHDNFGVLADAFGVWGTQIGLHVSASSYSGLAKNAAFVGGWTRFNESVGAFLQEVSPAGDVALNVAPPGVGYISWNTPIWLEAETGYIGMGTKAPQYQLDVQSDDAVTASFNSSNGTGLQSFASKSGGFAVGVYAEADDEQSKAVQGIATATSVINYGVWGQTLSTQGRGVSGLATNGSGVNYGVYGASNSASGYDFYAGGLGVNYGATSSRRWKNNIVAIDHPLEKLAELRGVYFDWDEAHGGRHDIGMIAEEVGAVLPEIVSFEDNGVDASGMDYSKLTPLLVEAVNALRAENVTLRSMNDQQRSELSSLTARMAKLEEMIGKVKGSE